MVKKMIQSILNGDNDIGDFDISTAISESMSIELYHEDSQRVIFSGDSITVACIDINIMTLKTHNKLY